MEERKMKLRKLLVSIVIVSMLVSMAIPMASAPKPEKPDGGKPPKEEPPADPVIAVVTPTGRGYNELVVMNSDGSNRVPIYEGFHNNFPSWSPDGSSIAFTQYYDEIWRIDVDVVDGEPVGSNPTLLFDGISGGPEWSPGGPYGGKILFTRGPNYDLEVIPATGGDPEVIHYAPDGHHFWRPVWSPGGDYIAFMDWDGKDYSLKIVDVVSKEETLVVESFSATCLDWARQRDANEIAYSIQYKVRNKWIYELYTVDIDTGNRNYLFEGKRPTWSPDDKLCFEHRGLVVHDFDTGENEEICNWGYYPDWCRSPPIDS
jgi:Tol biopolymer transport system component